MTDIPEETGGPDERCMCADRRSDHDGTGEGGEGCRNCACVAFAYHWPANTAEALENLP